MQYYKIPRNINKYIKINTLGILRIFFIYQKEAKLVEQIKIATFFNEHCYLLFTIKLRCHTYPQRTTQLQFFSEF